MSDPTVRNADAMAREKVARTIATGIWGEAAADLYFDARYDGSPDIRRGQAYHTADLLAALSPADGDAGVEDDWLVAQLAAWPTRVDREKTTNIEYLMKAAARRIRALTPTETGEQGK